MTGQFEDSEEVTVVERRFVIVRHRRQKYRCQCNGHVETAAPPPRLGAREDARGHHYSVEFAVEVATQKYLDHRVPRMPTEKGGNAAEEMRAGPSESGCRTRLQTTSRCVGQEPAW